MTQWLTLSGAVIVSLIGLTMIDAPSPPLFAGLLGAMAVTLLSKQALALHVSWFRGAQALIGATVAVQIDVQALGSVGSDVMPILLVVGSTLVTTVLCGQLLRLHQVTAVTATFASVAGGASGMIAVARDFGADERVVMVIQYLRVLCVLLTLPVVVSIATGRDYVESSTAPPMFSGGADDYAYVALAVVLGVLGGQLLRLPSPALLGPMLFGIALRALPVFEAVSVPRWVQAAGFLLLGAQVGLRFTRESLRSMSRMMPTALLVTAVSIAACAALGLLLSAMTGESRLDAYLATTPGGLPAVLATSTDTSSNVTFVTAAQSVRMLLVLLLTPVAAKLFFNRSQ